MNFSCICLSFKYLYLPQTEPDEGAAESSVKTELDVKKQLFTDAQTNTVSPSGEIIKSNTFHILFNYSSHFVNSLSSSLYH